MTPYESAWVLNIRAGNELGSMLQRAIRALLGPARPVVCCQDLSSMLTPSHFRSTSGCAWQGSPAFGGPAFFFPGRLLSITALSNAGCHYAQDRLVHSLPAVLQQWPPWSTVVHRASVSRKVFQACLVCFASP